MKITKIGHCCLLLEVNNLRVLTDPGGWNEKPPMDNIDLVLITHEHPDHLHIESVKEIVKNNPEVKIITNKSVGKILSDEGVESEEVVHMTSTEYKDLKIEGFGEKHADVYPSIVPVENTGYLLDGKFFIPGDALYDPEREITVLALPVAGPWLKLSEAIDYAKQVKPKYAFPIHDGMMKHLGSTHVLPEKELKEVGIDFRPMNAGDVESF